MDKLLIQGGEVLSGEVQISGAKNAALPVMAAALLSSGKSTIHNVPGLMDIKTMARLLESLGANVMREGHTLSIGAEGVKGAIAHYDLVKTMRASVLVLAPMLARTGRAEVSLPGGCAIGQRPVDLHITALKKMGADIQIEKGYIIARAEKLKGAHIYFDISTVTGTENIMMAAALADGITTIENAAMEPEVKDLADVLEKMGVKVSGAGTRTIEISGTDGLQPFEHTVIPDRIECGTFMVAAAITGGELLLKGCRLEHLEAVVTKLEEAGATFEAMPEGVRVTGNGRPIARDVRTLPYPGFPTDMQAQFMALMSKADGLSTITETVFPGRFMHVAELRRMNAEINVINGTATIKGVQELRGAEVMATDLRASASLVVAALAAKGQTRIDRLYHLDRGYENMEEKLIEVGAKVERVK